MSYEPIYAEAWIKHRLNDADLKTYLGASNGVPKIFARTPRQGTARPYLVYSQIASGDMVSDNQTRLFARPLYWVRIIYDAPPTDAIRNALNKMDSLLSRMDSRGTIPSIPGYSFHNYREDTREVEEEDPTTKGLIVHTGGEYRIEVFG